MTVPVPLDHHSEKARHENWHRKPLVDDGCHLSCVVPQRGRAELWETNLLERNVGQIEHLSSSRLMLSVHSVLEVLVRCIRDAFLALGQEVVTLAENHRTRGAHRGACRLLILLQALVETELALDDLRIPLVPLKLWHIEGAGNLTVAAPDTERTIPRDRTPLVLLQRAKRTAGCARGIKAVHALLLDKGEVRSIRLPVELDDVLGLGVEVRWDVPES